MGGAVLLRLGALIAVSLLVWLAVAGVRAYAAARKRKVLSAAPATIVTESAGADRVKILAFSSEDCSPCHRLQKPALRRLLDARGEHVMVVDIDAPSSPELTRQYAVLTVPTTVVLDAEGRARAVNYGFAPLDKLLRQVDDVLMTPVA